MRVTKPQVLHANKMQAEVIAELRSSNAALIAENEALKKRVAEFDKTIREELRDPNGTILECANELQAKLSIYTSWTPQDPGTKEAMECAEGLCAHKPANDRCIGNNPKGEVLAHALRAAMVRLEEAEKGREKAEAFKTWTHAYLDNKGVPIEVEDEHLAAGCRIGGRMDWAFSRFAAAESQVAALTASLASVTSEVERLKSEKDYDGKEVLAAELAELRKRMEAAERVVDMMYDRWDNGDDCYEDPREFVGHLGKACQFSDEELNAIEEVLSLREGDEAPVESKPKEGA